MNRRRRRQAHELTARVAFDVSLVDLITNDSRNDVVDWLTALEEAIRTKPLGSVPIEQLSLDDQQQANLGQCLARLRAVREDIDQLLGEL